MCLRTGLLSEDPVLQCCTVGAAPWLPPTSATLLAATHKCWLSAKMFCYCSHPLECWPPGADAKILIVLSSIGLSPKDAELLGQEGIEASVRGRLRPSADGSDVLVDLQNKGLQCSACAA